MTTPRPPLRERKKQHTRDALVATALDLFTERGFSGATLDELCDAVDVSKRTFFRYFGSKEDVATATSQDMWARFLDELRAADPAAEPLIAVLRDALLAAVAAMPATWADRVLAERRLAARTPSMEAHGLYFCERTSRAALELLHDRPRLPDALTTRLALEVLVAAFHVAVEAWSSQDGRPSREDFAAHVTRTFDALPRALA
ncbi:TetR family transcriptional regulator [Saccharothrix sp. Mg75]|uniref:TetR family transcriptional regulator n=1 Tax=Saccharothrix sp. Mg75 TaxID=3445357 RepID=UPI003EEC7865